MSSSTSRSGDDDPVEIRVKFVKRGVTKMKDLARIKNEKERHLVKCNKEGQPVGHAAKKMQSYIGLCVRRQIPPHYTQWTSVPRDLKNRIWECIEVCFLVPFYIFIIVVHYVFDIGNMNADEI